VTRRILVAIVIVAALAVAGFGVPLAVAVANRYHDDAVVALEREATTAAIQVPASAFANRDPVELPAATGSTHLALYDNTGLRLQGQGPDHLDGAVAAALAGQATDASHAGELVVAVPVSSEERVVAVIRAGKDLDLISDQIHRAWLAMTGLAAAVLVTAGVVAGVLARRLGQPIRRLAGTATRLGDGDFTARAQPSGITEIDTVAAALDTTADRLGRLVARERAFSADASHQLRTPLAGLRLQLESALEQSRQDPAAAVRIALTQVDRLETTIDDLLALRRDTERRGTSLRATDVLDGLERRWRGPLAAQGRPLRLLVDDAVPRVLVSPAAVRQILDVLVANAIEHGQGTVTVTARGTGGGAAIDVTDDGPGVAADQIETVFARRAPGQDRGIGLALARSLAEAEDGRLLLRAAGPSPTFSLVLPSAPAPPAS
jgi:signal transduction histidine kinase